MKLQKFKYLLIMACLMASVSMYAQSYEWAATLGGSLADRGQGIMTDANGNVYTTGFFEGTADFDPNPSVSRNLSSSGNKDAFIQKLDANGDLVWAGVFGGSSDEEGVAIAVDGLGNIYVSGYFFGTADFNPGPPITNLTSNGGRDGYVVKLDSNGVFQWARSFGGPNDDQVRHMVVDSAGNVYTTGFFFGTGDFDPGPGTLNLNSEGNKDVFVQKLDPQGNLVWAKSFGGSSIDEVRRISVDPSGNVYTTGDFRGTSDFDPDTGTFSLSAPTPAGATVVNWDAFVQKLDTDGNFFWAKNFGGLDREIAYSIGVDGAGNVYTCGTFRDTADFDPGVNTANLIALNGHDMFVSKLSASGDFRWARAFSGVTVNEAYSVHVDPSGNVYTTGTFNSTVDFDPGAGVANLRSAGSADIFVQKMDSAGLYQWAIAFGGAGVDAGINVYVDQNENLYTTGYFSGVGDFDPDTSSSNFTSNGSLDVFTHKLALNSCVPTAFTDVQTACGSFTWIDGNTYNASTNTPVFNLTNAAGCDSVVTLNLTINSVSDITTFLTGGQTITANNTSAAYQWLDCDNNFAPINGETGQSFSPTSSGNYAVELRENGCVDTSACVSITSVSNDEIDLAQRIALYPNPTTGEVIIHLGETAQDLQVRVWNAMGQELVNKHLSGTPLVDIELNGNAGLYLIEIIADGNRTVRQVLKK